MVKWYPLQIKKVFGQITGERFFEKSLDAVVLEREKLAGYQEAAEKIKAQL